MPNATRFQGVVHTPYGTKPFPFTVKYESGFVARLFSQDSGFAPGAYRLDLLVNGKWTACLARSSSPLG
jgi:hypothetical protein